MNRVTRGEKILDRLVNEGTVSRCGADWLIAAIDPFHDKQLANLTGWPDLESGNSVVRCVKQSVTIARPATVPSTDNWDAHILMWPWLNSGRNLPAQFTSTVARSGQNFTYNQATPYGPVGGVQAFGMAAGSDLNILQAGTCREIGAMDLSNTYTAGAGRLVGMGFEVHNTTAELNKQGAVCVYRQMANSRSPSTFNGLDGTGAITKLYSLTGIPVRFPPLNTAQALLVQGSRQWDAKEGCYVVAAFNDAENPAYPIQPMVPIISASGTDDLEGAVSTSAFNFPRTSVALVGESETLDLQSAPNLRVHPVHQSGAIFTGLSPTTTLTINWNVYYESFPGLSQLDILPLARPSCEYDPDALDLFERILQDLPVGVKVIENGLGDWFLGAISDAAKFVSPLLMSSGNPLAMGVGAVTKYIGDTAGNYAKQNAPSTWEAPRETKEKVTEYVYTQPKKKKKTPRKALNQTQVVKKKPGTKNG